MLYNRPTAAQLLLGALLLPSFSYGNDFLDLSLQDLQRIPVEVASLFEDDILDVASSTSVVTAPQWQQFGAVTLGQALEATPSVFANTTWGGTETLSIRGYATELSVRGLGFSINGIPLSSYAYGSSSYMLPRVPLDLLSKVEVIRGPGSTLYGSDAFHGVVSTQLTQSDINLVQATSSLNEIGSRNASIVTSYHKENWQWHIGYQHQVAEDHDLPFHFKDLKSGDQRSASRAQAVGFDSAYILGRYGQVSAPIGQFEWFAFSSRYQGESFQGIGNQFFAGVPTSFDVESSNVAGAGDTSDGDSQLDILALSHEIRLGDGLQIQQRLFRWYASQEWTFDNSEYPDNIDYFVNETTTVSLSCRTSPEQTGVSPFYCAHQLYQGLNESHDGYQLIMKQPQGGKDTQWVIGAGTQRTKILNGRFERIDETGQTLQLDISDYVGEERTQSHFLAQGRTAFSDEHWLVTYGLRYDDYSDIGAHSSPRLGVVYKQSEHWTQKWLYGHAYRAPSAVEQYGSGTARGNDSLEPETIDTFEYIVMGSWPSVSLETVLFYSKWRNAIILAEVDDGETPSSQYLNRSRNQSHGVEVQLKHDLSERLNYQGFISYVRSRDESANEDYVAFPSWIAHVKAEYDWPSYSLTTALQHRAMFSYQLSDQNTSLGSKDTQNYHRTDISLSYRPLAQLWLTGSVRNLFDSSNQLPSFYGSEGGLLDYGRTAQITLDWRW